MQTPVTALTSEQAKQFFLKNESYCRDHPVCYIDFTSLLAELDAQPHWQHVISTIFELK
jgi:hypothetical protein